MEARGAGRGCAVVNSMVVVVDITVIRFEDWGQSGPRGLGGLASLPYFVLVGDPGAVGTVGTADVDVHDPSDPEEADPAEPTVELEASCLL